MVQTTMSPELPQQISPTRMTQLRRAKLISLLGSACVSLSAGSNYAFSSFAPQLQESLHLTSTQINLIGIAGNAGVYLSSPFWGRFIDKRGPRLAIIMAAVLVPIGYAGLSLSYTGGWSLHSTPLLFALNLLTGIGNSGAFTAAMNAQAKSWDGSRRGTATAVVLSGFGLSAFFYSSLSHWLFSGNTGDYLLLLAFGSMTSMIVGLFLVKVTQTESTLSLHTSPGIERSGRRSGAPAYTRQRSSSDIGSRATIWNQPESLSAEASDDEDERYRPDVAGGSRSRATSSRGETRASEDTDPESQGLLSGRDESKHRAAKEDNPEAVDISGRDLFKQVDFYLIFSVMTLVSGAGLLLINNVGTITKTLWDFNHRNDTALLAPSLLSPQNNTLTVSLEHMEALKLSAKASVQQLQARQVSAISLCNASGRIIIGLLSDYLVNRTGSAAKRVWLLIVVTTLAFASQLLAAKPGAIETVHDLLFVSVLTGLAYGTLFGICPVLVFEWFGMAHFSQNYGFVSLSPVVAGNVFNLLFGRIYDSHVLKDSSHFVLSTALSSALEAFEHKKEKSSHGADDGHVGAQHLCMEGEECYRQVFVITTVGCALAILLSIVLIARRAGLPSSLTKIFSR